VKLPNLLQGEPARMVACVELACKVNGVDFPKAAGMKRSGVQPPIYVKTLSALEKELKVRIAPTMKELALQFGTVRILETLSQSFKRFQVEFMSTLSDVQRARVDMKDPIYTAAVFFLVSKRHKLAVDQKQLLARMNLGAQEFKKVCDIVENVSPSICKLSKAKRKAHEEEKKRKRGEVEVGGDGAESLSEDEGVERKTKESKRDGQREEKDEAKRIVSSMLQLPSRN